MVPFARYQVAIVGGGPAGLASAITLSRDGLSVVVVERTDYTSLRVGEHLPPGAKPLLASLGLQRLVEDDAHANSPGVRSAWGTSEFFDNDYLFHPYGEGLNLARPEFDRSMVSLATSEGAQVLVQARVIAFRRVSDAWELHITHGSERRTLRADFMIDATGRGASLARRLGARPIVYDNLVGLFARVSEGCTASPRVYIEAEPDGWWYSTGLADGSLIATFFTDSDLLDLSQSGRTAAWQERARMATIFNARGPLPLAAKDLHVRNARTQCLDRVVGEGWLAVGDAAMSFDPLSSDGICKGLQWGRRAADVVSAMRRDETLNAARYQHDIETTFSAYLATRWKFYALEKRWPNCPFWQRRHRPPTPMIKAALRP